MKQSEKLKEILDKIHKLAEESVLYLPKLESLDCEEKELIIKDEKIRKAVRAWAEANGRDLFKVINEHFNCCKIIGYTDGGHTSCNKIEFSTTIAGADKNYYYTLDELCGEEEE